MKRYINLVVFISLFYSSWAYAFNDYDPSKVSPQGLHFSDLRTEAYCMMGGRNEKSINNQCRLTEKSARMNEELVKRKSRFWGAMDLRVERAWGRDNIEEYKKWVHTLPKKDFIELTNHPNSIVRISSFQALVTAYPEMDIVPIIIEHINDTDVIERHQHDEFSDQKIGDVFFDIATDSPMWGLKIDKFSASERKRLFRSLLTTPNELDATTEFLLKMETLPEFHEYIEPVLEKHAAGLVYLAKYQREQDIELILTYLRRAEGSSRARYSETSRDAYQAIKYFPHKDFFLVLKKIILEDVSDTNIPRPFTAGRGLNLRGAYRAIAAYENGEALALLNLPFQQELQLSDKQVRFYSELVFYAITQSKAEIYDEMLLKFWGQKKRLSVDGYMTLSQLYPVKTLQLIGDSLRELKVFSYINTSRGSTFGGYIRGTQFDALVLSMFDLLLDKDRDLALDIIKNNLAEPNIQLFRGSMAVIRMIENRDVTALLVSSLEDNKPIIVTNATRVLLSLKDCELNKKVVEVMQRNKRLRESRPGASGRWDSLYELLENKKKCSYE